MSSVGGGKVLRRAWTQSDSWGWVELAVEWEGEGLPPLSLEGYDPGELCWHPLEDLEYGKLAGYFWSGDRLNFLISEERLESRGIRSRSLRVAGSFNGWGRDDGQEVWRLKRHQWKGETVYMATVDLERIPEPEVWSFKFVSDEGEWLGPDWESPSREEDERGNTNFLIRMDRRRNYLYGFATREPFPWSRNLTVIWAQSGHHEGIPLQPGSHFLQKGTDQPLGAVWSPEATEFRVFAPRATSVELVLGREIAPESWETYPMAHEPEGSWYLRVEGDWKGGYYGYRVSGMRGSRWNHFDPGMLVVDPYALAMVGRNGPGIVIPKPDPIPESERFHPPRWEDLIIVETHLSDLLQKDSKAGGAPSYLGLKERVDSGDQYLAKLAVNAVEFQPLQQNDAAEIGEYHWGYMTVGYFAPHSGYAMNPADGSVIEEVRELVRSLHRAGKAVILDVVYNHYGEPNHLLFLDKLLYFRTDHAGNLYNHSGCGNDLRTEAHMVKRLILDSLRYWVETFDIDGFRFDLAELLGKPLLVEIERELKRVKPSLILIAEPWSFRGHIAAELRDTGFASWNDGYREEVLGYLLGDRPADTLRYFLTGSPEHFARWPAQTVNYLESHDDRCLLDRITTNSDFDGSDPSLLDRRRIHLSIALLMVSIGIPMFAEGVDFLRSKGGLENTYQNGEANALDYERLNRFPGTHQYFQDWCRLRLGKLGRLFRPKHPLPESFWGIHGVSDSPAIAVLFNADRSHGDHRLLLMMNPSMETSAIHAPGWDWDSSILVADTERVDPEGLPYPHPERVGESILLPGCSLGLFAHG